MNTDSTVSAVKKSNLRHWQNAFDSGTITREQLDQVVVNMKYFTNIANTVNFDAINSKKFMSLFPNDFWTYDKPSINRVVYETVEQHKAIQQKRADLPHQESILQELLESHPDAFRNGRLPDLEYKLRTKNEYLDSYTSAAQSRYRNYIIEMEKIGKKLDEIEEIEQLIVAQSSSTVEYDERIVGAIRDVTRDGDFVYLGPSSVTLDNGNVECNPILLRTPDDSKHESFVEAFSDGTNRRHRQDTVRYEDCHMFLSSQPLVCQYVNTAANVSLRLEFGYWLIMLDSKAQVRFCRPVIDYMGNQKTFHPHFSFDSICWGSSGFRYEQLIGTGKPFLPVLKLLKSLVETYSPDNPYIKMKSCYKWRENRWLNGLDLEVSKRLPLNMFPDELKAKLQQDIITMTENSSDYSSDSVDAMRLKWGIPASAVIIGTPPIEAINEYEGGPF